jgi:hypothetical protein
VAGLTLDIATKIVPESQNIWAMFPGLGRKFLRTFLAEGVIFLDAPALKLTPHVLANDELLRQHVAMSQAWSRYLLGVTESVPSRRAAEYSPPKKPSFSAAVGNVRNVFVRMRPGDLVLVGGYNFYEPVHIGEIAEPFDPGVTVHVERYGREDIPARRVRWIDVRYERRFLSQRLSMLLSNRKTVVSVSKQEFGDEVYRIAYGDYVSGADSRYIFKGPKYNNIAISTVPGIDLISYFCAAYHACDIGEIQQFSQLDIKDAINNYFEQEVLYSFEIDFRSPGSYILHARNAALPLLVALLVAATSGDVPFDDARSAEITNSATATPSTAAGQGDLLPDQCPVGIKEKYKSIMESIHADRYNEICQLNKDAQNGVGLKVDIKKRIKKKK